MMAMYVDSSMDFFHCHICLENMVDRDPRSLRCNHTYCYQCIIKLFEYGFDEHKYTITCPTCRVKSNVRIRDMRLQLPSNFYLKQMQDKLEDVKKEKTNWCEVCKKKEVKAETMCTDCSRMMCQVCTKHHKIIPAYSKHQIIQLETEIEEDCAKCDIHNTNITSICQTCQVGLCLECTLDDQHSSHLTEIHGIKTGLTLTRQSIKSKKNELFDKKKILERSIVAIKQDEQEVVKTLTRLEELKRTVALRYHEADILLKETSLCQDPINVALSALMGMNEMIKDKMLMLEKTETLNDKELLQRLDGQISDASDALDSVQEVLALSYEKPRFIPDIIIPNKPVGKVLKTKLDVTKTNTKVVKTYKENRLSGIRKTLLLDLRQDDEDVTIQAPLEIIVNKKGNLLLVDNSLSYVQEISKEGFRLKKYYSIEEGCVRSVSLTDKYLYLAQFESNGVTGISQMENLFEPNYTISVFDCSNITSILSFPTPDGDKVVISDDQEGKIKQRDKALVENVGRPTYMTRITTSNNDYFIVTEAGKHQVKVFDGNWNPISQVKVHDSMAKPCKFRGHTATPWETFLVVDGGNNCISEYNLDGEFIKHFLTAEDGIDNPRDVALSYPHLWLTECNFDKHAAIKLYKIE